MITGPLELKFLLYDDFSHRKLIDKTNLKVS